MGNQHQLNAGQLRPWTETSLLRKLNIKLEQETGNTFFLLFCFKFPVKDYTVSIYFISFAALEDLFFGGGGKYQ